MMKKLVLFAAVIIGAFNLSAQVDESLYMPIEFKNAYENGTRKWDGTVSAQYWQNRSEYTIRAKVDPYSKILSGTASITYYNNGPDSIRNPGFHTYHDYYRPESKKGSFFSSEPAFFEGHQGVVIEKVAANGKNIDLENRQRLVHNGTNYVIRLEDPIAPGASLKLEITWNYEIPGEGFERSGAIDSTSMFIGYWYPEMAVLDDIDGWDRVIYDAATEFYHDYSDYDIEIEVPDNFIVWASVPPSNPEAVYSEVVRERLKRAENSSEAVRIWGEDDFLSAPSGTKIWKYTARNFPDFSFALSDHFIWEASTYEDEMGTYFLNTAFPAKHPFFASVMGAMHQSLQIFHNDFPVYPFPYKYFSIFNGLTGGGMEFPGMANDQEISGLMYSRWTGTKIDDETANLGLTLHEMCHMYFPFMMGLNEKKYAWMDEGMASFMDFFTEPLFAIGDRDQPYLGSINVAPIMVPSHILETSGINSYTVGSYANYSLYKLLGKEVFTKCMHSYMDEWKYKHPTPYDFMFTFNRVSGKNLNWFWKQWFFDWGYMDMGIKDVKKDLVTIENAGGRPIAFSIEVSFDDGSTLEEEINPGVWRTSKQYQHKVKSGKKKIESVRLVIPSPGDAIGGNNTWPREE